MADIERQVILSTLERFKGHRVKTAGALGIGVRNARHEAQAMEGRWSVDRGNDRGKSCAARQELPERMIVG